LKENDEMTESLKTQLKHVGFDVVGDIRDAEHDLSIFINPNDISRGLVGNPMECTTAQCLQRAVGQEDTRVAVFLNVAYIQTAGESGAKRYIVSDRLREGVVKRQDNGSEITPGIYKLLAPAESKRLGYGAEMRERNRKALKKAKAEGFELPVTAPRAAPRSKHMRMRWQRND
jgi:hypothetical protein